MMDKDRIKDHLTELEKYIKELENLKITPKNVLTEREKFHSASILLLSIINKIIDAGNQILGLKVLGTPSTYKDIFWILGRRRIISEKLSKDLMEFIKYRNIIAHEYGALEEKDISNLLKKLHIVRDFQKVAKKIIEKEK